MQEGAYKMAKVFNTTAVCVPEEHYMVDLAKRLKEIKVLVDKGKYFTINRARQYGKTTTLLALEYYLQEDYYVVSIDFQTFDHAKFENGNVFSNAFASSFLSALKRSAYGMTDELKEACEVLKQSANSRNDFFSLKELFEGLGEICRVSDKPVVLMIDEVDSVASNRVFLDFLAQLRAQYIKRFQHPALKSVVLAGVYDVKNLKQKIRPDEEHKYNSPWNIAADFKIDMSLSTDGIAGMLEEYEDDYHTGMDVNGMAGLLWDYTSGYPFLVSRLCQLIDEEVSIRKEYGSKKAAWTKKGFDCAFHMLLMEKNTLFDSLIGKIHDYPELNVILRTLLFTGKTVSYNTDETSVDIAAMFGFIKNDCGNIAIANRIFEMRLYNYYLSTADVQKKDIYGSRDEKFLEEEGRERFIPYLKPITNGTENCDKKIIEAMV